jgi:O-acetyl-ADP-ribose deacetylase (regulator of RNase III)
MSADTAIRETDEHIVRLMTKLIETEPEPVGSVLVRGKNPIKFLAIVHDVNQEPTWKEEWIKSALEGIFREAERRNLKSIALPLIGTLHGSLEKRRFVALLQKTLEQASIDHLKRLWLIVPDGTSRDIIEMLKSAHNHNTS